MNKNMSYYNEITISGIEQYKIYSDDGKTIKVRPKWRPIETAPIKEEILVYDKGDMFVAYRGSGIDPSEWRITCTCEYTGKWDPIEPTHWMSLPKGPDETP
jgi:hypothetical protein